MRLTLPILMCATLLSSTHAQAPSLSGVWTVTAEAVHGTTDDGGTWSLNAVSGALTLDQKGNDVSGSWKGQMPAPWKVTGQCNDRAFELRTEWRELSVTRDGTKTTAPVRWIFRGTVTGDTASGTMGFETKEAEGRSQAFNAKRTP